MKLTQILRTFISGDRAPGIILIACTIISLSVSNILPQYAAFWHINIGHHSLIHWINDGLMTIFFLLIGLELEREVYQGELSTIRSAMLPALAALGGMVVPAAIYFLFNAGVDGNLAGIGVPMATDIAFALAALSLAGKRVPAGLKIFLTALAVIDDLGAILVIAIFYTSTIHWLNLGIAGGIFTLLLVCNRLKVHNPVPYLLGGVIMWYFMMGSGVHATITGVLVAFAIPFGSGDKQTLSYRLEHWLSKPVAFFILPIFALANTSITVDQSFYRELGSAVSIGIMAGLFAGKPIGILLFTYTTVKLKLSKLTQGITWKHIFGAGLLGGIGFTMSIFISLLAFNDPSLVDHAKISVMIASLLSGLAGLLFLKRTS